MHGFLSGAGVALVLVLFVAFGRHVLREWIAGEIKHYYDLELEQRKAELRRTVESGLHLQAAVMGAAAAGQAAAFSHRVDCIQRLWKLLVSIRVHAPVVVGMTEILTTDEILDKLRTSPSLAQQIEFRPGDASTYVGFDTEAEELRLLAGEYLWSLFYSYRALTYRVCAYFDMRLKGKHERLRPTWQDDEVFRHILGAVLTADEWHRFQDRTPASIGGLALARGFIEARFIAEASRLMSGAVSASEMSEAASAILEAAGTATSGSVQSDEPNGDRSEISRTKDRK